MKKIVFHIIKSVAGLVLIFNLLTLLWVSVYRVIPIPQTKLMFIESQNKEIAYVWVDLEQISGSAQLAAMCAEDQFFLLHNGLDFKSISDAEQKNLEGGNVRGASTLTQQVAKNVFLWPDRSWIRKGAELYFALLIEMVWDKERIMEVYLNVAELGDGVFGVEAAVSVVFWCIRFSTDQGSGFSIDGGFAESKKICRDWTFSFCQEQRKVDPASNALLGGQNDL